MVDPPCWGFDDKEQESYYDKNERKFFEYFKEIDFQDEHEKIYFKCAMRRKLEEKLIEFKAKEISKWTDVEKIKKNIKEVMKNGHRGFNCYSDYEIVEMYLKKRKIDTLNRLSAKVLEQAKRSLKFDRFLREEQ